MPARRAMSSIVLRRIPRSSNCASAASRTSSTPRLVLDGASTSSAERGGGGPGVIASDDTTTANCQPKGSATWQTCATLQCFLLHCKITSVPRSSTSHPPERAMPCALGELIDAAQTPFAAALQGLPHGADRELAARLLAGLWESDPLADDVVVEFSRLSGGAGWRMLDRALRDG